MDTNDLIAARTRAEYGVDELRAENERLRAENFRIAALIGYGALLAGNKGGQFTFVIDAMDKMLFPDRGERFKQFHEAVYNT